MAYLVRFFFILGISSFMNELVAKDADEVSLSSFKWQHRLVIANVSDQTSLLTTLKTWPAEQLNDRKLKVFLLDKNQTFHVSSDATLSQVQLNKNELDSIAVGNETIALIGLDGGVKARFPVAEFNPTTINQIIDSMPMRMAESFY